MSTDFDRIILEQAPSGVIITDPQGIVLHWTPGAQNIFAYTPAEAIGRSIGELTALRDPGDSSTTLLEEVLATGHDERAMLCRTRDGSVIYVDVSSKAINDPHGKLEFVLSSYKDITQLKAARDALLIETKFRDLLELTPDSIVMANATGRIVLANAQAEQLFGYQPGELRGQLVEVLLPKRFHHAHVPHRADYFGQPRTRTMGAGLELYGIRKDEVEFPVEISLSPIQTEAGPFVISAIRDITERKKAERKFRGLLESAPDAIVIVNAVGEIVLVNSQTELLFGYAREDLLGQKIEILIPARFAGRHPALRGAFVNTARPRAMGAGLELFGLRKDGSEFPVEISLAPLDTEDGVLVSSAIRDISDRKQIENALQEKSNELERANLAKDRFLASMSHELRTPLNAILGFAELLADDSLPSTPVQKKGFSQHILTAGAHLLTLINEILDLAKIESGSMTLSMESVGLAEVMEEARSMVEAHAANRGVRLVFPEVNLLHVHADRTRLKQIILNLLSNAIKYNRDMGVVVISCAIGDDGTVRISVQDTGTGLGPEQLAALFQPFNRLGQETGPQDGTGIGLVVTRRLAELMGGQMGVSSKVGIGSVFWIELTSAAPSVLCPALPAEQSLDAELGTFHGERATVLYVEDNPANLVLVEEIAKFRRDVHLITAIDGERGITLARATLPKVILLDINLPGISGTEVQQILRDDPLTAHIPVIALTANAMAQDVRRGLEAGFFRYLTKPIKVGALTEALDAALASAAVPHGLPATGEK